ncbi:MAG: transposase [Ignavibacteriales bacterium]
MTKYKNEFRVESARLKDWDYSTPWWYYVTVNTKDHYCWFGEVVNSKMILNELGLVAENYWKEIPKHYPSVELDYYVVMPNHLHGIIILNNAETCHGMSLQQRERKFSAPIKNSLSMIINQFKGAVKRWCNKNEFSAFAWQPLFYDRIIRNEKELFNIRKYIEQNPLKWELKKSTPEN